MATQQQIDDLAALYAGYFNRAADPAGLQFWIDQIDGGREFSTIAADFAASPEAEALYPYLTTPGVSSPRVFITSIYENLFNRAPDAAGLAFWSGVLADGTVSVGDFIAAIINGAVDDPAEGTFDKTTLDNKIDVSLHYADAASNTPGFTYDAAAAAAAVAVLDGVTYDPATVVEGRLEVDAFLNHETLTLTAGVDVLVAAAANAVFDAHLAIANEGFSAVQTLQGQDVLTGGNGFNVLNADLNGTGTSYNPTISNIQQYNLTAYLNGESNLAYLDLDRATGYEQLWDRNSRANLTLDTVHEVAVLGMDNVRNGSTYQVNYDSVAVDTQVVVVNHSGVDGNGTVTLHINGVDGNITNLELNVSDGVDLELDGDAADIENLVIAGSGTLNLYDNEDFANLETLNTLGYDGDVILDVEGGDNLVSVLTGVGNDWIAVSQGSVNGGLAVDLGEGENTLAVNNYSDTYSDDDGVNALDFTGGVQNVQTLELRNSIYLHNDATLNLDGFDAALTTVQFDGSIDGDGYTFAFANAPEVLPVTVWGDVRNVYLDTGNIVDLTMNVEGYYLDLDGVTGADLTTLTFNQGQEYNDGGQIWLDIDGAADVSSLETLTVLGAGNVDVDIDAAHVDDDMNALATVSVTAADDATLNMYGYGSEGGSEGFTALQTVEVHAQNGDAWAFLSDVSGAFTLDVTAGSDATVHLIDTGATSATVAAAMDGEADVYVGGMVGNTDLASLTVSGDAGYVTLEADLHDFTTLDVSGVATYLEVNTSGATFNVAAGGFIDYQIGATSDGNNLVTDVYFDGNAAREVYNFTGNDIGNVEITNFSWGADPAVGDRLDLSSFAASSGQLVFTNAGTDLVITDLASGLDHFTGSITIVGGADHGAELATFNIIYG
jgi:hypothetical protein